MMRRTLVARFVAVVALLAASGGASLPQASATDSGVEVLTGSVSAFINNVPGSSKFSFHANTVGWKSGTIHVSYEMEVSSNGTSGWTHYFSDDKTCNGTSCSTVTQTQFCSGAWYRMTAKANGPGGNAENNPAVKIVHVYSNGTPAGTPESIPSQCRYVSQPI